MRHWSVLDGPNSMGVPKMPGAMAMLRMPLRARLREVARDRKRHATPPPLNALYAARPIWPS